MQRAFEYCGARVNLTNNPDQILSAERLVLPGVGSFANAMQELERLSLIEVIHEIYKIRKPLLGICLGMQLLFDESEEFGITTGLGLIPGRVIRIPNKTLSNKLQKIPHIGWSKLELSNTRIDWQETLLADNYPHEAAYFVHSFMAIPKNSEHRIADCVYGGYKITAMVHKDNITGCQFHPEKSGEIGLKILRRFILE